LDALFVEGYFKMEYFAFELEVFAEADVFKKRREIAHFKQEVFSIIIITHLKSK
jgi:hypothetical protein